MRSHASRLLPVVAAFMLVLVAACGSGKDDLLAPRSASAPGRMPVDKQPPVLNDEASGSEMPDFSLVDVNPNSASAGLVVSPRQDLHKVSAWYFGHAT